MRKSTIALSAVLALLTLLAALFLLGGTLKAEVTTAIDSAANQPRAYAAILDLMDRGDAPQVFSEPLPGDPSDCRLEDVNIALTNPGLIPAEWVSVAVTGAPGDVAVYAVTGEGETVPGRGALTVNLKLAARAGGSGERVYRVQYYVFGMKRSVTVAGGFGGRA